MPVKEVLLAELEYLGYLSYTDNTVQKNLVFVSNVDVNRWGSCFVNLYRICDGNAIDNLKVDKKFYLNYPLSKGNIICINSIIEKPKKRKNNETGKFEDTGEMQHVLMSYEHMLL